MRQNQACQSASGFFHLASVSWPRDPRPSPFGTTTTAMPLLPVKRRQIELANEDTRELVCVESAAANRPHARTREFVGVDLD